MIENLQDDLYQLVNKQAKGAKLCANIRQQLEGKKYSRTFFKSKYCSNRKDISKPAKKIMKNFTPRIHFSKLLLMNFLAKFLTERKCLLNKLTFVRRKYL